MLKADFSIKLSRLPESPATPRPLAQPRKSVFSTGFLHKVLAGAAMLCGLVTVSAHAASINGERIQWYPLNVDFNGPQANETDDSPNPFLDYRLNVIFTSPSGRQYKVPGFFAGDGNGSGSGSIWRARFSADEAGTWRYRADFRRGSAVAIELAESAGEPAAFNAESGEFSIAGVNAQAPGFQRWGRLDYNGDHYLKFRNGPHWVKVGTDSPENLLGYAGFDGTVDQGGARSNFLHTYSPHIQDFRDGDPYFVSRDTGVDSRGIIGAVNYLSGQGVNSVYFLPMNLGGDGQETYPFLAPEKSRYHKTHFDISKLDQWNIVLAHAQRKGIALNIVLNETELANREWQDNGQFGLERKLYYREMIARFGYLLAAKWNICEENNFSIDVVRDAASYLNALDWTEKPVSLHTPPDRFENYEQLLGNPLITASSIQYSVDRAGEYVETWRRRSRESGVPWVIDLDENDTGLLDNNADDLRKRVLYDILFSGGNLEWYFGFGGLPLGGDVTLEDFRTRETMWTYSRHARQFMDSQIPFWNMQPADQLVSNENGAFGGAEVFAAQGDTYAVYLPNASGDPAIQLPDGQQRWTIQWYNPVSGNFEGDTRTTDNGGFTTLGQAPSRNNDDWVVLVKREGSNSQSTPVTQTPSTPPSSSQPVAQVPQNGQDNSGVSIDNIENQLVNAGNNLNVVIRPVSSNGSIPSMFLSQAPDAASFNDNGDGSRSFSWTPTSADVGDHQITVTVEDAQDRSIRIESFFTVTVQGGSGSVDVADQGSSNPDTDSNNVSGLQLDLTERIDVQAGNELALLVAPTDSDGGVPAVWIENLPNGAVFADNLNGTRTLRWVPQSSDLGVYNLTVVMRDTSEGTTSSRTLTVQVNN